MKEMKVRLMKVMAECDVVYAGVLRDYPAIKKEWGEAYLYVQTGGDQMVRIRYVDADYWAHTDGNGGFGSSWCCHAGTPVYVKQVTA
jgi:hypothetical protein